MNLKKNSNNLNRRKFVKNSALGLAFLTAYPALPKAEASVIVFVIQEES